MKNYWIGAFKNANSHQQNEFSCGIRSSQSADGEMNPQRSWNKTRKRADSPTEAISKRLSIFTTPMKAESRDLPDDRRLVRHLSLQIKRKRTEIDYAVMTSENLRTE